jgi:hypothetical protein
MDISTKKLCAQRLDENGNVVRKDGVANSFEKLGESLDKFSPDDRFVMESPGFNEPYMISLSQWDST